MATAVMLSLLISGVQSQECVQNLPTFANQGGSGVERILPGTQVIIPDYTFTCYGNVTQWGAWVFRRRGEEYTLLFQVWRRSGGGQGTTGCYDLVDNNLFLAVDPDGGEIVVPVAVEDQIQVRPGDVVGFSVVESDREDNGVVLQDDDDPPGGRAAVTAWHGPIPMSASSADSCRIRVGNDIGYELHSSTSAAPIITVVVVAILPTNAMETPLPSSPTPPSDVFIPPMSAILILPSPTPPPNQLPSRGLPPRSVQPATMTPQTREPTPPSDLTLTITQHTPPSSTGTPSTTAPGSLLSIAAVIGIVLGSILAILMAVVVILVAAVMKHSHSKQATGELYETPDSIGMKQNAYGTSTQTQHIATTANEAYGCRGDIPVVENVAYTPAAVNIPTVQNEAYGKYEMESRDNTGDGEYAYVTTSM